jgi:hypothetical protein
MFKKLSSVLLVLVGIGCVIAPAQAQDTIGLYADFGEGGELSRSIIVKPGTPFDVVVVTSTDHESSAIEFIMTELVWIYSGVFKVSTTKVNDTLMDLGDNDVGEYLVAYGGCVDAGTTEIVRVRYANVRQPIGPNVVLSLRGFGPGDNWPSSFGGQIGYADCDMSKFVLTPEPWDDSSNVDPTRISGLESTDGILVLNPEGLSVPAAARSMGTLKSQF